MTDLRPDLEARVLAAAREPSPTRGATRARTWLVLASSAIVVASLYFAFGGPEHGAGRPAWFYGASAFGWLSVAAVSAWGALGGGASSTGRPRAVLLAIAVGTPAVLLALTFVLGAAAPELGQAFSFDERPGLKCFGLTVAAAAFPLIALALVRRGSDAVHPAATGAALGAACGASAGVMVEMWCPVSEMRHVVVGHVAPIVLLAALGAALGMRVLAVRAKRGT